jgi:hypothetical protein
LTSLAACEAIQGRRLVTVRVKGVKLDAFVEELWKIGGRVQQVTRPPESKRRAS